MIRIARGDCPKILTKKTKKVKNIPLYNKKEVVTALWKMQLEKCSYCEQKIPEEGHIKAVEHFRPQSIFKNLKNDWENLLLACAQCNGKKSDKFPLELTNDINDIKVIFIKKDTKNRSLYKKRGKNLLINPSDNNTYPESHVDYILDDKDALLGLILHKTRQGKFTISAIGLSDLYHTKKRRTFYCVLYQAYLNLLQASYNGDQAQIEVNKCSLLIFMNASYQYAGFARAFARHKKLDINFNIAIPS